MFKTAKKMTAALLLTAATLAGCQKNEIILPTGNGSNPTNGGSNGGGNGGTNGGGQSAPDTLKKQYSTISFVLKPGTTIPESIIYTDASTSKPDTIKNDAQGAFGMVKSDSLLTNPKARGSFNVNAASIALDPKHGDLQFISKGRVVALTVGKNALNPKVNFFNTNMTQANMIETSAAVVKSATTQTYKIAGQ